MSKLGAPLKQEKSAKKVDLEKVEGLASRGLNKEQIALALGISKRTLFRYIENNPEIDEAYHAGKAKGHGKIANKLFELAEKGNLGAIVFYLKAACGWRENQNLEIKPNEGGLQITFKNDLNE